MTTPENIVNNLTDKILNLMLDDVDLANYIAQTTNDLGIDPDNESEYIKAQTKIMNQVLLSVVSVNL